jgi:hypothetical protein
MDRTIIKCPACLYGRSCLPEGAQVFTVSNSWKVRWPRQITRLPRLIFVHFFSLSSSSLHAFTLSHHEHLQESLRRGHILRLVKLLSQPQPNRQESWYSHLHQDSSRTTDGLRPTVRLSLARLRTTPRRFPQRSSASGPTIANPSSVELVPISCSVPCSSSSTIRFSGRYIQLLL